MKYALPVTAALLIMGCSSPKDANESNFKAAINDYYLNTPACISTVKLPYTETGKGFGRSKKPLLDELVKIGFLESENTEIEEASFSSKKNMIPATIYSITPKGENNVVVASGGFSYFCYGTNKVIEINNFTEINRSGYQLAEVSYEYKVDQLAEWAKNSPALASIDEDLKQNLKGEPLSAKALLILTNNGWIHQSLHR